MSITDDSTPPRPGFQQAERVRIADLTPGSESPQSYVEAQIALVWPYSSLTRQFAFLLSEADARPYKAGRQLKVTLHDGAARAVQATKVGIGDTIKLLLQDCVWQDSEDPASTPGKRVRWDLTYREAVRLEVLGGASQKSHTVQYKRSDTPSPRWSPVANGVVQIATPPPEPFSLHTPFKSTTSHRTSAFYTHVATPHDPFSEDIELESGRSRKRTKFARPSGSWRFLDNAEEDAQRVPSSPVQLDQEAGSTNTQGRQVQVTTDAVPIVPSEQQTLATPEDNISPPELDPSTNALTSTATLMGPPKVPAPAPQDMQLERSSRGDFHGDDEATTPRLHPLASPGLPLVSPLVKVFGTELGYFPDMSDRGSELDAISHPATDAGTPTPMSDDPVRSIDSLPNVEAHETILPSLVDSNATLPPAGGPQGPLLIDDEEDDTSAQSDIADAPRSPAKTASRAHETEDTAPVPSAPVDDKDMPEIKDAITVLDEFLQMSPVVEAHTSDQSRETDTRLADDSGPSLIARNESSVEIKASDVPNENLLTAQATTSTVTAGEGGKQHDLPARYSPIRAVDGTSEFRGLVVPEHTRSLQGITEQRDADLRNVSPQPDKETVNIAADKLLTSTQVAASTNIASSDGNLHVNSQEEDIGERTGTPQKSFETQAADVHLITPMQTQERPDIAIRDEKRAEAIIDIGLLSPVATQTAEAVALNQPSSPVEGKATPKAIEREGPLTPTMTSSSSRRVSQRLTRKSEVPHLIDSPFFTKRKTTPQDLAAITETATEHGTQSQVSPESQHVQTDSSSSLKGKKAAVPSATSTALAYYPSLASLNEYYGQAVDIIAVCTDSTSKPAQAKSGPRDWHVSFRIIDAGAQSEDPKVAVQIFRPYRSALPAAHPGDVVILRSFKVQTVKHRWTLLSTDASAWAVFKSNVESRSMFDKVVMTGPELEYGRGEIAQVKHLLQWWSAEGQARYSTSSPAEAIKSNQRTPSNIDTALREEEEDAPVLQSVELPISPRRSRRLQHDEPDTAGQTTAPPTRDTARTATPQPTRHQPPRRARTKTPNAAETQPLAPPMVVPGPASDTSSVAPSSPTQTRRPRTRSTLSPNISFSAAGSASVASSVAAHSPTSPTFPPSAPSGKAKGKTKARGKGKAKEATPPLAHVDEEESGVAVSEPDEQQQQPPPPTPAKRSARLSRGSRVLSPRLVHELRDGMRYVDEKVGVEEWSKRVTRSQVHELRDGNRYVDVDEGAK
ncbi:uncharacterized protein HMPREF1541_10346 [Cyphellophora europaea CBS 101466]|uniref:Telomeric single stranded DNA binding POT1/Cdc13 domain-containing protein n=1 Tax=Cyphellophora europaea (strain CBS 101466) TaxID=1220924 RepID=W2S7I7_CYPE1|nr:uncharacterized protein HMPREF1541_10346 [Cyphellophora europaea CBS 101466]ETN44676.1 hypothetical protein HMPREF1541_10346 [Cyphellophora europaea CBS 101466]